MHNKILKAILFSLMITATLLVPAVAFAQYGGNRGVFGRGQVVVVDRDFRGMMDESTGGYFLFNQQFGIDENGGYVLYNQTFGQDVPLGSGLLVLVAAGAGYAFKKRKSNMKQ